MKIAILTAGIYPYVIGGMQKHSFYLTKFLAKRGVDITLVHCVAFNDKIPTEQEVNEALELEGEQKVESICLKFPQAGFIPGHYIKESYLHSIHIYEKLKDRLNEYDFIYAKGMAAWKLIDSKRKGLSCPPIGVKFHGYEMFQKAPSFKMKLEQYFFRGPVTFNNKNADYVFSYGGKITSIIQSIGVKDQNIIEIPTGIESNWCTESIQENSTSLRKFLFIGRYERRKGIEELNTVLKEIMDEEEFEIHFVGPIPASKKLKSDKIVYHGKVMEKDKIQAIIDQCQVLVTPSHSEGMPNVIMEGMARGLAVIATDVGAVAAQVDSNNGWCLEPGDEVKLKAAFLEAIHLDDEQLMIKRESSLEKVIGTFTWEKVSEDTLEAIQGII